MTPITGACNSQRPAQTNSHRPVRQTEGKARGRQRPVNSAAKGNRPLCAVSRCQSRGPIAQARRRSTSPIPASENSAKPVSYTHLDVYKRQVTDCSVIRIEADAFLRLLRDNPEVAIMMLSATYVHLQSLVMQIEALKAQTGAQRVAEFLLELAPCDLGACEVVLPYDKFLIAGRLGMKPESLSRAFVKLRDQGVTIRQNNVAIDDVTCLLYTSRCV